MAEPSAIRLAEPRTIPIQSNIDDRGFLYQIFGSYDHIFPRVVRAYVVGNFSKGVIRGFHMHKEETKAYFVVSGASKFVVVSDNNARQTFVLSSRNPSVLVVPPNNPHGWVSLEDNTILIGLSDRTLEQSLNDDFRSDPMKLGSQVWETKPR